MFGTDSLPQRSLMFYWVPIKMILRTLFELSHLALCTLDSVPELNPQIINFSIYCSPRKMTVKEVKKSVNRIITEMYGHR